jgi:hypothetical protein
MVIYNQFQGISGGLTDVGVNAEYFHKSGILKAQADVEFDGIVWSADRPRAVKFESETWCVSDRKRRPSALIYIKSFPVA